ncbi:MAG: 3-oxoadipate enol-lactonase [Acidimicrobiia bacterium]
MSNIEGRTGKISWEVSGGADSRGLLMIHSLGTDQRMWADQVPVLSDLRQVVTFDLPGHGTSRARSGEYSIDDLGNDALAVADAAGLGEFDLCGISLGGVIALWIAVNHPGRLGRLIACNTSSKVGSAELWAQRIDAVEEGGMSGIREAVVPRFVTADLGDRRPEAMELVWEMFDSVDPVGYIGCCAALRDADLTASLGDVDAPTLLIGGTEDVATPPQTMEKLADGIPHGRLHLIEGAAHLSNIDRPGAFNDVVEQALRA